MVRYETLEVNKVGPVMEIVLNRPGVRNAMNTKMNEELDHALTAAEADAGIKAATVRGAGPVFSAGHDLKEYAAVYLGQAPAGPSEVPHLPRPWYFSKPLLAGVHGYVGPDANTLVACCDFVIAAAGTRFSFEQSRMGSIEPMNPILTFALPMGVVKKLWLMGGWFDAEAALQWQYVQRVVPVDRLERELRRWAEQAALVPTERYATAKQDLRRLYAIRGLVAGAELRPPTKDSSRERFYRTLEESGMRAALQVRDAEFDEEISKI